MIIREGRGGDSNGKSKGRKPMKKGETRKGGKREKGGGIVSNTHTRPRGLEGIAGST